MDQNREFQAEFSPVYCPHLGMLDDAGTCVAFPSLVNACHYCVPRTTPDLNHQGAFCLTSNFQNCPVFQGEAGVKFPKRLADNSNNRSNPGKKIFLTIMGILGIVLFIFLLGWSFFPEIMRPIITPTDLQESDQINSEVYKSPTVYQTATPVEWLLFRSSPSPEFTLMPTATPTKEITNQIELTDTIATEMMPTATNLVHVFAPSKPAKVLNSILDTNSSGTAKNRTIPGGDDYYANKYERPFSQEEMTYFPDLDIWKAEVTSDSQFFYFSIYLVGADPESNSLRGIYGVELDLNLDGRGEYLVLCEQHTTGDWTIEGVRVLRDSNKDVGGRLATYPEAANPGDGYEDEIFSMANPIDPDGAWCRVSTDAPRVEIALHRPLIGSPRLFGWGVWADGAVQDSSLFDYNDHFSILQAGSPITGNRYYPLKSIHLVDSTCREAYGFTPSMDVLGMCFVAKATATGLVPVITIPNALITLTNTPIYTSTPTSTSTPTNTSTNTPTPTSTFTPTPTSTYTPTPTSTYTPTPTSTYTPTNPSIPTPTEGSN